MADATSQYWLAFDRDWFAKHQTRLLRLVNAPLIGRSIRRALNLRLDECVVMLTPNAAHYAQDGSQCVAEVYTAPVIGMNVYRAGRPLWWAMHYWDELVADRHIPEWSFGFDQLSKYTGAGTTIDFDGTISSDSTESYAKVKQGNNLIGPVDNSLLEVSASKVVATWSISRIFLKFDLAAAYAGVTNAVASAATLSLMMEARYNASVDTLRCFEATIDDSNTSINTTGTPTDWNRFNNTDLWGLPYPQLASFQLPIDAPSYTNIAYNSSGIELVSSKLNSILKLSLRHSVDCANLITVSSQKYATFWAADYTVTQRAPKLTITYSRVIAPDGIDSSAVTGAITATVGTPKIQLEGIDSSAVTGAITVTGSNVTVTLEGIDSTAVTGTLQVATAQFVGIDSSAVTGTLQIGTIQFEGIDSSAVTGDLFASGGVGGRIVRPEGIDSSAVTGTITVTAPAWIVTLTGIEAATAFGQLTISIPYPDGTVYTGPMISRLVDQVSEYNYTLYEYEDGGADVNVQPTGVQRFALDYDGISADEVMQLTSHFNAMRGRAGTFSFFHKRRATTYSCRYVSMTASAHIKHWSNSMQVILEAQ